MGIGVCDWYVISKATGEKIRYVGTLFSYGGLKARLLAKRMNKLAQADVFEARDFGIGNC